MMRTALVDTNLLFGILALQLGLIEQADLLDAFQRWSRDRSGSLAQVLLDRGAITEEDRTTVEGLVRRHVARHGGDVERSLAAITPPAAVVAGLRQMGEPALDATLARLLPRGDGALEPIGAGDPTRPDPGLDLDATSDLNPEFGQRTSDGGRFRMLRPHARGGIGMVSVALDAELHREVALKEILPDQAGNLASRGRFVLEAEVTGRLEHPGVVPVYGLGATADGRPYYAMRFIRGETLKEAIDGYRKASAATEPSSGRQPLGLRQLLSRFLDVCNTMAYAHSRGVIHRDLKPSNIMLGPYGETLVVDWGLAKVVGRDEPRGHASAEATLVPASGSGSSETLQGTIVGTPAYMSPEQAEGRLGSVGPASDVYSLGATLYCILTGRPPFEERDIASLLRRVQRGDFPPPRQVDRRVPPALDAIVAKAMALEPRDRYQSATELAQEIDRWLADEPVRAYREPFPRRAARWARRHKPAVAALGVLLVSAVVALAVNSMMLGAEKNRTDIQRRLAEDNFQRADVERRRAELLSANLTMDRGLSLCEHGEVNRGLLWLAHALEVTPAGNENLDRAIRANLAAWGRQLTSLQAILRHPTMRVAGVAFDREDGVIITVDGFDADSRMNVMRWDAVTGKPLGPPALFEDPLGWINDARGGTAWARTAFRDELDDWFSPDRSVLLVDDDSKTARLREVATGRAVGEPIPHPEPIVCAAFSRDGSRIVIGSKDGTARVYVAATGAPAGKTMSHKGWVTDVAFSRDGSAILTASRDGTARLWNAVTGDPMVAPLMHGEEIVRAAISPDGKVILTGGLGGQARLWDAASGTPIGKTLVHGGTIFALAFSPDSKTVLSGSMDRTGRLWDAATGEPRSGPLRHESELTFVGFSPDGQTAITCSDDNTARLWDAATGRPVGSPLEHMGTVNHAAFNHNGSKLVTAGWDFEAQVWDTATSLARERRLPQPSGVTRVAYSPDGRSMVVACDDGTARLYDAATTRAIGQPLRQKGAVRGIAFSPNGTTIATGSNDRTIQFWNATTGEPIGGPVPQPAPVNLVAYSPDGRFLLVGDHDGVVRFWDVATRKPTEGILEQTRATRIEAITFSPDGRTVATGSDDMSGRLWDAATRRPIGEVLQHQGSFRGLVFHPDGKTIVSGGWDKALRFWDSATGKAMSSPLLLQSLIIDLAIAPDGRAVLVGCADGTARVWDLAAGKPISPILEHEGRVTAVAFRRDGRAVLTGSTDGTARVWEVPRPAQGTIERTRCWAEVLTRMELSADGMVHVLTAPEWEKRRLRLSELDQGAGP